jgi:hypothetical protein
MRIRIRNTDLDQAYLDEDDAADRRVVQGKEPSPALDLAEWLRAFEVGHSDPSACSVAHSGELVTGKTSSVVHPDSKQKYRHFYKKRQN